MSRARHKEHHRASGGGIGGRKGEWVSGNEDVKKEAEGKEPYDEGDERKRGGKVKKKKHEIHAEGEKARHRMDRPKRAHGGRVGSDRNPFSSAKNPSKGPEPDVEDRRGYKTSRIGDERDNSKRDQN
jgi:hypothetical protein